MNEKSKAPATRKPPILVYLFLGISAFLCWLSLGIKVDLSNPQRDFELARNHWRENNISNYEMTVTLYSFGNISDLAMGVEDNQIVSLLVGSPLSSNPSRYPIDLSENPAWYSENYSSFFPPNLRDFEILSLFEFTETYVLPNSQAPISLCNSDSHYELSFNQEYGFVEEISYSNCSSWNIGLGLFCPIVSDCKSGFRITEFLAEN